jgi:hypothetical protein
MTKKDFTHIPLANSAEDHAQLEKEIKERKELEEQLMEMPELEQEDKLTGEKEGERRCSMDEELIHKNMYDINTFQAHENELYLRGTDEYGKDFQICFDSYNFLEWIDTEHLKYIKKQLIKHIKTK